MSHLVLMNVDKSKVTQFSRCPFVGFVDNLVDIHWASAFHHQLETYGVGDCDRDHHHCFADVQEELMVNFYSL